MVCVAAPMLILCLSEAASIWTWPDTVALISSLSCVQCFTRVHDWLVSHFCLQWRSDFINGLVTISNSHETQEECLGMAVLDMTRTAKERQLSPLEIYQTIRYWPETEAAFGLEFYFFIFFMLVKFGDSAKNVIYCCAWIFNYLIVLLFLFRFFLSLSDLQIDFWFKRLLIQNRFST